MHTYEYTGMRTHVRILETIKDKFSTLKLGFGTNPTSSGSRSKPPFFNYKSHTWYLLKNTEKLKGKHKIN